MRTLRRVTPAWGALAIAFGILATGGLARAQGIVKLKPETIAEFDAYVKDAERVMNKRVNGERPFLWTDDIPERRVTLRRGEILIEGLPETPEIEGGLLHVWLGAMFVPETTGPEVLKVLQDYDRHHEWYPEVTDSRLLSSDSGVFKGRSPDAR